MLLTPVGAFGGSAIDSGYAGGGPLNGGKLAQVGLDGLGTRRPHEGPPVEEPQGDAGGCEVCGQAGVDGAGGPGDQQRHGRWCSAAATPSSLAV